MAEYGVIGGSLWGNRGAEAMVATTVGMTRRHDAEASFHIWTYQPSKDRALLGESPHRVYNAKPSRLALVHMPFAVLVWLVGLVRLRWPSRLLPSDVRALRRERALFDVTGISFHDGRLSVSIYNLVCLWPAILMKVPVVRLSQAMGPFRKPLNRWPARFAMRYSTHTYARGAATAEFVEALRVKKARWSIAPDVAFSYEDEFSLTDENPGRVADVLKGLGGAGRPRKTVALVPSSLVHKAMTARGEDYIAVLQAVTQTLVDRGFHVLLAPNATSEGSETLRNNDIVPILALRERIEASAPGLLDHCSWVDFDVNTRSIRALLGRCEVVVTSRFHAMVAALSLGVPVLVIGWSHKYGEVLEMFDCEGDALDFSEASAAAERVEAMVSESKAKRKTITAHIGAVRAGSQAQFDILDRIPSKR